MRWHQRLINELAERGWSRDRLASEAGIEIETVHKHCQGRVANPRAAIPIYARALGIREGWLRTGEGPKRVDDSAAPPGAGLDVELLAEIVEVIEEEAAARKTRPSPQQYARIVAACYQAEARIEPALRLPRQTVRVTFQLLE